MLCHPTHATFDRAHAGIGDEALGGELAGRNALDHGVDAVLSKPVRPQELLRQVESVLQSRVATLHEPSSPDEKAG